MLLYKKKRVKSLRNHSNVVRFVVWNSIFAARIDKFLKLPLFYILNNVKN